MNIAVDARELIGRPTGVGRYLAELLACWSRQPEASGHHITLISPAPLEFPAGLIGTGGSSVRLRVEADAPSLWWEQRVLPAAASALGAHVLFCPGYSGPLFAGMPVVVTLHDVSFWAHPEWFRWREGMRRRLTSLAIARRARLILTVSDASRREIVRLLGVSPQRIRVTLEGVGGFFDPTANAHRAGKNPGQEIAARDNRVRVVLTVGSIFNRRHVDVLIRAFARIASYVPDARLVIVGENRTHPYQDLDGLARELRINDRVDLRSYVSDEELRLLYGQARAFVFLSTYEGFGLTPLEAIAAGVPTLMYDTAVAREIQGELAQLVPIGDVDAVVARLRAMLERVPDGALQAAFARAARARYPWAHTASATLAALQEASRSA
jgi:glycosyltransferase involved in cell wall biosynthesis